MTLSHKPRAPRSAHTPCGRPSPSAGLRAGRGRRLAGLPGGLPGPARRSPAHRPPVPLCLGLTPRPGGKRPTVSSSLLSCPAARPLAGPCARRPVPSPCCPCAAPPAGRPACSSSLHCERLGVGGLVFGAAPRSRRPGLAPGTAGTLTERPGTLTERPVTKPGVAVAA